MDFSKLSTNNQIAAGGGAIALISGLLPWFKVSGFGFSTSVSGYGTGILVLLSLVLVAGGAGVLIAKVLDVKDITVQKLTAEQLAMTLVGAGAIFALLRLATKPGLTSYAWGSFVAIAAIGAAAAGTFLSAKDVGVGIPTIDDFKGVDSNDETVIEARPVGFEAVASPAPAPTPYPAAPTPAPVAATTPPPPPAPVAATTPPPPPAPVAATTPPPPVAAPAPVAATTPPPPPAPPQA